MVRRQGPANGYQDAVESTHNGNYAWNGQPIPNLAANSGAQGYGQTQGLGYSANQGYSQNQSYGQSQGYGQDQGYGQNQSYGQSQSYGQNQSYGQSQSYSQNQGNAQNQGYSQNQGNTQNQGYSQQQQTFAPYANQTASYGQQAAFGGQGFLPEARDNGAQSFKAQGGMPIPGSSGDQNAAYGQRNTGINHADARDVGFQGGYTGYGANGTPVQYGTFMRDGTQYGKGPHTIDPNKAIITGVHYDNGAISAVQFQDGTKVDIAHAIAMAEAGLIEDVNTGRNREGQKTLRSYPDGDPSNNLSNLPRF